MVVTTSLASRASTTEATSRAATVLSALATHHAVPVATRHSSICCELSLLVFTQLSLSVSELALVTESAFSEVFKVSAEHRLVAVVKA